ETPRRRYAEETSRIASCSPLGYISMEMGWSEILCRVHHVALILNREGRCCDSYEGRCDCGVNIDSCHSRVGNHGEGICQRGVGRDSDRASMNISIRVKLRSPG